MNLTISNDKLNRLKIGIEEINEYYNTFFKNAKNASGNLLASLDDINKGIESIRNKIKIGISNFNNFTESINETNIHENLRLIKEPLNDIKTIINNLINNLKEKEIQIEKCLETTRKLEISDSLLNINGIISDIIKYYNLKINENFIINLIKTSPLYQFIHEYKPLIDLGIKYFDDTKDITDVEKTTSVDLLFILIMDFFMDVYLEDVKRNFKEIIDGILNSYPEIDLNLGFIKSSIYKKENIDIDFTKDHSYIKDIINNIYSFNLNTGMTEIVGTALKLALSKTWKSEAKFVVFTNTFPAYEISIFEKYITEMDDKDISMFCLKLKDNTDRMYFMFEDIYNRIKSIDTKFMIVNLHEIVNPFSYIVILNIADVYISQKINKHKCLIDSDSASRILKEKYGINNPKPDNKIRFILGPCNPVLLIPGIFSTKLLVEFNCNGLATEERKTTLRDIRLYCGDNVCKNESVISEEHHLMFSIDRGPFSILNLKIIKSDKYRACLGHILLYFQNENECPKVDGKNLCYHSKYVKVAYYGGTTETKKKGRCGIEGISNVIQSGDPSLDIFINYHSPGGVFHKISKSFKNIGYNEGFSLGGLPNDYRRYLAKNNFAINVFKNQIERLYKNTGKPVVIIAHSHGNLVTLTNLLRRKNDKAFLRKIKKFISIAPPFAGSSKLLDVFLNGMTDFNVVLSNKQVTNFDKFGQLLAYKFLPTVFELRPLPIAYKVFNDPSYKELGDAIRERLTFEKILRKSDFDYYISQGKAEKFDNLFKEYFPSLLEPECAFESLNAYDEILMRKCSTNIFNVGDCPTVNFENISPVIYNFLIYNSYCNKNGQDYLYQGECGKDLNECLDQFYYSDKIPYVYDDNDKEAINFLLDRFNNLFSQEYGEIDESYFESFEFIRKGIKASIEYQKEIDLIKDLPVPPVDTELIYSSFLPTYAMFFFNEKIDKYILEKGGDGTVPTWSSLLTGLKWIYDKKKNNLPQNIKLIEYCSRLATSEKFKFNPNKNQKFSALGCRCIDDTNNYFTEKKEKEKCDHSKMLSDNVLINYLFSTIYDSISNNDITEIKKSALKNYDSQFNYIEECNNDIFEILETMK